jgi:hypothetical protein
VRVSPPALATLVVAIALAIAGCGGGPSFGDAKIVKALELEPAENGYHLGGDPFCLVEVLLNDSAEVEESQEADAPLIASREGNVGVEVETPFAPDCEDEARAALNRLEQSES